MRGRVGLRGAPFAGGENWSPATRRADPMHRTKNDIPENKRAELVKLLNDRLAEAQDLFAQVKTAHWNVRGPHFYQLHLLFDTIAEEVEEHSDLIAERAAQLGGTAEGTVQVAAKKSSLPPYPLNVSNGRDHVEALSTSLAAFAKTVRESIDQADKLGDKGTSD